LDLVEPAERVQRAAADPRNELRERPECGQRWVAPVAGACPHRRPHAAIHRVHLVLTQQQPDAVVEVAARVALAAVLDGEEPLEDGVLVKRPRERVGKLWHVLPASLSHSVHAPMVHSAASVPTISPATSAAPRSVTSTIRTPASLRIHVSWRFA